MKIFKYIDDIQNYLVNKKNIALVPTMGGLHIGHLSLIDIASKNSNLVVVSLFLNPAQFADNEDLSTYPQNLDSDIVQLKNNKVDVVFIPDSDEIYPENYNFSYQIGILGNILCAKSRPKFFPGITKAVYKLCDIIKPNVIVFGEKDFQQLLIVKKMVQDFNLSIKILSGKIIREKSGLALSTRNNYLTIKELDIASKIHLYLQESKDEISNNLSNINYTKIQKNLSKKLTELFTLDYCEILDSKNLGIINKKSTNIIILVALNLNNIRLIDNLKIKL